MSCDPDFKWHLITQSTTAHTALPSLQVQASLQIAPYRHFFFVSMF